MTEQIGIIELFIICLIFFALGVISFRLWAENKKMSFKNV